MFKFRTYARALRSKKPIRLEGSGETINRALLRLLLALWRRQSGKTTTMAGISLDEMAEFPGRLITFCSASLLVGREVIEKEASIFRGILREYNTMLAEAAKEQAELVTIEDGEGHDLTDSRPENFAEVFESRRLVVKLHHDRNTYSRMQVIAPNPATARGFTGSVIIDEAGLIPDFTGVWDAMIYIMSSDPSFKCRMSTTPPIDESHPVHELIQPPPGMGFDINPAGHWYRSSGNLIIHRVDVHDGLAAGAKIYHPETAEEISPEEDRRIAINREAWDRNMGLKLASGGTTAVSRVTLSRAQNTLASPHCLAVDDGEEFPASWADRLSTGDDISIGYDVATTDGGKSNPSSITVSRRCGKQVEELLKVRWKSKDYKVSIGIAYRLALGVSMATGHSARALCIDATSERYYAASVRDELRSICPVKLIISSETIVHAGQTYNKKTYMGNIYTMALEDGLISLPQARWVFDDYFLVRKERGLYVTPVDANGNHGDSFDSGKLAYYGFESGNDFYAKSDPATFLQKTKLTRKERDSHGL